MKHNFRARRPYFEYRSTTCGFIPAAGSGGSSGSSGTSLDNELGVSNEGRMTSAHFDHHLLAGFHFIQLGENHIRQRPPLNLIRGE